MVAPVFPEALAVIQRIVSMKFRVAPAVIKRGRVMAEKWVCVPNHCNVFPEGIPEALDASCVLWEGSGDIRSDGLNLLNQLPPEPVVLVGCGYGGLVAWWVSLYAKERVLRLVLMGTIPSRMYIPFRLRLLLGFFPKRLLLSWRKEEQLSRLYSVHIGIPENPPPVPTLWFLGRNDPFHRWQKEKLPYWSEVEFRLHDGGVFPPYEEWVCLRKFS